jgi:hypothetical protein
VNQHDAHNPFSDKELLFPEQGQDTTTAEKQKNESEDDQQIQLHTQKRGIPNREGRATISRALKSWLDNVIVPTMVRKYSVEREQATVCRGSCCDTDTDLCST